ncbi:MAG TPA: Rieske (2Fe-2S) protein [Ktedonobacterales bacterium]|jgi:Rieske Fe-S protein|nr:Rieske (2Fe-2S) protein [Ktedonobacterales bacterium]
MTRLDDEMPMDLPEERRAAEMEPAAKPPWRARLPGRIPRWQAEFPYHWDTDDLVGRRELLRFAVMTSGTLFAATAGIAVLGQVLPMRRTERVLAAHISEIGPEGVHYFTYPTPDDQAVLLRLPSGSFAAYSARCTHLSCAVYFDRHRHQLICPCHDGVFEPQTGTPIAGPPQRPLPMIVLQRDGDALYAVEEVPR